MTVHDRDTELLRGAMLFPDAPLPPARDLSPLLNPRSIAIIGVSGAPGAGPTGPNGVLVNLLRYDYPGKLCVVNPKYETINGVPSYASIEAVPHDVDLVIIGVRGELVPGVLRSAVQKGCRAAIVITAGFAETATDEGRALQDEIVETIAGTDFLLCGPNCLGIININGQVGASATVGLAADWPKKGRVAVVSQSGSLSSSLIVKSRDIGLGLAYVVSCGNEAGLEVCDFVDSMLMDPDVDVVVSFVEGFRDIAKLRKAAARGLSVGKPWIVYKVGRTEAAAEAAKGHTGAVTGVYDLHKAFFRQNNVIVAETLDDLLAYAQVFTAFRGKTVTGRRLGVLSCSGGSGGVIADIAVQSGFTLPSFEAKTDVKIREVVASWAGAFSNPIDPGPPVDVDPVGIGQLLEFMEADANCDILIQAMGARPKANGAATAAALAKFHASSTKPVAYGWFTGQFNNDAFKILQDENCFYAQNYETLLRALDVFVDHRERQAKMDARRTAVAQELNAVPSSVFEGSGQLTEFAGKAFCRSIGLTAPKGGVAGSASAAADLADDIGFPVVVKLSSSDITHKSDVGGVRLNLRNRDEVATAYSEMAAAIGTDKLEVLVEQQVTASGCEVLLGVVNDKLYGPVVVVGLGGIWVEALPIRVFLVPPFSTEMAREAILSSRLGAFINGEKSRYQFDVDGLLDAIMKIQSAILSPDSTIEELEINPLLLLQPGKGAVALDAVVSFGAGSEGAND